MSWKLICREEDLIPNAGVAALLEGEQVAIFSMNAAEKKVFAISNWDPIGQANVLSRGIVGDINGAPVVASPLYKQHFNLENGQCLEEAVQVRTWSVKLADGEVWIAPN